jgi:KipI family sensor histidine kinase inhibitor
MAPPRISRFGERAVLVEVNGLDEARHLYSALRHARETPAAASSAAPWRDIVDLVPAARSVLVIADTAAGAARLHTALVAGVASLAAAPPPASAEAAPPVTIPVHYDGPDLAEVASHTGLTPAEVVAAHTGMPWQVAFGGFAPGFAYLVGGDPRLRVPRHPQPRTTVPAGAVALAGEFSGIYPRSSPGGWQLIGRTDVVLWDPDRTPPAALQPGQQVRFTVAEPSTSKTSTAATPTAPARHREPRQPHRALTVLTSGPLTTVQDDGRLGLAAVGVGPSGAADRTAYRLANRLVGNVPGSAALEVTLGGLAVRATGALTVCLTGAAGPATVDGRVVDFATPLHLRDGQELRLGMPSRGVRSYLAVRGGLALPVTLGSRSTDRLADLGPAAVAAGDALPVGAEVGGPVHVDHAPPTEHSQPSRPSQSQGRDEVLIDVLPGPQLDWFDWGSGHLDRLVDRLWVVSGDADRVGVRLAAAPGRDGRALTRHTKWAGAEVPSFGMVRGAVQVPPSGLPVILGADHPVTGGYPVIGVATEAGSDRLAQCRPGDQVRLRLLRV